MGTHNGTIAGPRLALLRGFELACDGKRVELSPSSERLLAFVGIHSRPLRRNFVSGSLWPDATTDRANANLRSALWRIPAVDPEPLVAASATHLCLSPEVEVDFRVATHCATSLLHSDLGVEPQDSLGLLCDDLLPDWYEDWVVFERERHRQLRLHALDRACRRLIELGLYGEALEVALNEAAAEPLRETAFRFIVQIHLAEGNLAEAVRQYRAYARSLEVELGVLPSQAMRQLLDDYFVQHRSVTLH
jgi:DNA-binding SARP family transcriptional activator